MRANFGEFTIDTTTRQLTRAGEAVHVTPKVFELLVKMIEASPKALTKDNILDLVWPQTFVADGTVASTVAELREVLGDDPKHPRFIRTVYGYGYAFCAELNEKQETTEGTAFRLLLTDREIALGRGENVLGRGRDSVVWLEHSSISRHHAKIYIDGDAATIEDLGSKNGTFVRGERIAAPRTLSDGDQLVLGQVAMTFRIFREGQPTV